MRCTKFAGIISAYVDSEANSFEQLALQEHLKNCPHCKTELEMQYTLREMVKESQVFSDNINISSSVMAAIRQKKQVSETDFAVLAETPVVSRHNNWLAVAIMFAITMAAVFSAHRLNSHVAVAEAEPMYTEYVYEHLSTELSGVYHNSADTQMKQVSYIK